MAYLAALLGAQDTSCSAKLSPDVPEVAFTSVSQSLKDGGSGFKSSFRSLQQLYSSTELHTGGQYRI